MHYTKDDKPEATKQIQQSSKRVAIVGMSVSVAALAFVEMVSVGTAGVQPQRLTDVFKGEPQSDAMARQRTMIAMSRLLTPQR